MEKQIYSSKGWKCVLLIVIPYLLIVALCQLAGLLTLGLDITMPPGKETTEQHFVMALFTLVGTVSVTVLFTRFVDQKRFTSLGFKAGFMVEDTIIGVITGMIIMLAGFLLLVLSRQIYMNASNYDFMDTLLVFGTFIFVGISEELLMRGYVLNNLMLSFNKYVALIISSLLFCVMHFANPNLNTIGIVALFLAGLLLGLCYMLTRNLWLSIALHFSWNFFQTLLGFNVSGQDAYSIITTSFTTENIWNGGNFGFEGSILSLLFQALAIVIIIYILRNRIAASNSD